MVRRIFALVFVLAFLGTVGSDQALAQLSQDEEIRNLIEKSEEEEADLERIPGADLPGMGDDIISGKIRLPGGEEVEKLRISQDREIDPETYLVGPGDVLQLYIWGEFDISYMLEVDPEGKVLIPTIGSFDTLDMSLAEAKGRILEMARDKYPGVEITVSLASMRFFTVYVTGAVLREGSHVIHPNMRLSDLIERAGGFLDELRGSAFQEDVSGQQVTRVRRIVNKATARRSIELTHRDGTSESIDLDMYYATGDLAHNPYMRMGDEVHCRFRDKLIYIFGSVNQPGRYEYREGDTIGKLLLLCRGLVLDSPLVKAELWRFREGTEEATVTTLATREALEGGIGYDDISHFTLEPNDMLFLRSRSLWQQMPTVVIYGEVNYRGRYRIEPGVTQLREIIDRAGGLTDRASLVGAKVIRTKMRHRRDPELSRLQSLRQVTGLSDMKQEDKAYLKTKARQEKGRASVDFERLFLEGEEDQNIYLESGDVVVIPTRRRTVTVSGQVEKPGLIDFEEGKNIRFYMDKAGGYTREADMKGARLIRAKTGLRHELEMDLAVEVGDEIWVPEKDRIDYWEFTQSTLRTLAEALTLIVVVQSFQ